MPDIHTRRADMAKRIAHAVALEAARLRLADVVGTTKGLFGALEGAAGNTAVALEDLTAALNTEESAR